ncbi:activator of Hsp90 ATPase 1-like family protein [Metarhizium robertsii]|uniref:Activator of Hsp90 ATPase 1 family protein n=2 Tax=Metarhizium robertsii TaxID=568076 RepID=E9EME5_METRA|nr:Activator of Hsp90 ATPase 1 family protein [Metarhizium robertsii ARSEF 23]EFZ03253.1 Activator of Hsp90 ATPase 1 family protein [Metarhizium robertsii ARSEF 23]EXV01065.1 activator of Hsp90 ATPase 1-like family protein [Metarhizium robertsii]
MQVNTPPSVNVGVLIRRPPHAVLEALADPSMTTRFCGKCMYGVSTAVYVDAVVPDHLIRFRWGMYDEDSPSTVEFRIIPCPCHDGTAYLRVVETGLHGPQRQPGHKGGRIHGGLHLCAERVEGRAGA